MNLKPRINGKQTYLTPEAIGDSRPRADLRPLAVGLWSRIVLTILGLGAAGTVGLFAENWPGFRGPTGQGISTETRLPLHWSPSSNLVWKTAIPGSGWSSPIVMENQVFLTTATEQGVSLRLLCLDRSSGDILWNKEIFRQTLTRKENKNSYASPTPVTDGQRVYVMSFNGALAAVNRDGSRNLISSPSMKAAT